MKLRKQVQVKLRDSKHPRKDIWIKDEDSSSYKDSRPYAAKLPPKPLN